MYELSLMQVLIFYDLCCHLLAGAYTSASPIKPAVPTNVQLLQASVAVMKFSWAKVIFSEPSSWLIS